MVQECYILHKAVQAGEPFIRANDLMQSSILPYAAFYDDALVEPWRLWAKGLRSGFLEGLVQVSYPPEGLVSWDA